jgi:beta-lactamase regulating signal transducer with metallopeptidase domain/HEAT repeat protein
MNMSDTMTLLVWLAKATALLLLAMGLTIGLRRAPAGARYTIWLATLGALLLVPAMSAWSPLPLPILPGDPVVANSVSDAGAPAPAETGGQRDEVRAAGSSGPAASAIEGPMSVASVVLAIWGTVAAALVVWLVIGALTVRRILTRGRVLSDEGWLKPLYETADRLDLDRVPRLMMSPTIEMPFACSILRPTIVLPSSAEQWSDERRRVVLFHELAHIRRRDLLGHTLGRVVCALYWFHPLVWSAAKQLRAESERACDDLVLSCGARASDYANHLLDIVVGVRRFGAPATALPMANRREFEGRMLAILDPAIKRAGPTRGQTALLTVGLVSVALTIAAVSPERRPPTTLQQTTQASSVATIDDTAPAAPKAQIAERARTKAPSPTAAPSPSASPSPSPNISVEGLVSQLATGAQQGEAPDTALLGRILRTDRSGDVRRVATWALHGRREGIPLLLERLRVDEDESVREMAAWALVSVGNRQVETALAEALKTDPRARVRKTAAWGLGYTHTGDNVAALEGALADESSEVRFRALWALGQHSLDAAPPKAVAKLQDADDQVRLIAAWLVGQLQDKTTLPALRAAFLKEEDRDVQRAQFRALLFMEDRSQEVIDHAMKSDNPDLRARAVRMIAGLGAGSWPWPWPWPDPRPSP